MEKDKEETRTRKKKTSQVEEVKVIEKEVIKEVEKKTPIFATGLLTIILILTYIFTLKYYEPAKNVLLTGGIIVYPLTFLILALIQKEYGFKQARKSIYISSGLYVLFMVLLMIAVLPKANYVSSGYNSVVQFIFTNNSLPITESFTLYYPALGQFFGIVIAYMVSHLIYATIYNAIGNYTIDYLAAGLGLFIAYIVDKLLFVPMLFIEGLTNGTNTFEYVLKNLTSEFITAIFLSIIIIIIYVLITSIKKVLEK